MKQQTQVKNETNQNQNVFEESQLDEELFIKHQMDQEEQDQHDLQLFHEQKQEEEEEVCPGHEYEFLEPLPSGEPDVFKDLYICIICSHQHVITHHTGIRG
jgi:hypothetical protein